MLEREGVISSDRGELWPDRVARLISPGICISLCQLSACRSGCQARSFGTSTDRPCRA